MTVYETWALVISICALLIPFLQWVWKKWIVKAKLNHYQTGYGLLYINQSGSYISIQSVFEAVNKPVSVKNLSLCVRRERDNQERNYIWSTFTSPTNMQFVGNNASVVEIAHPFRIEADNVYCAFTEYAEKNQNAFRTISPLYSNLINKAREYKLSNAPFDEALKDYVTTQEYEEVNQALNKELFWLIDKYEATITAQYGKKKKIFTLQFEVTKEQNELLQYNMKEFLVIPLKDCYGLPRAMRPISVQMTEK